MKKNISGKIVSVLLLIALVLTVLPVILVRAAGEVITSTPEGGAWNNATTWVGGVVPDLVDDSVVIATAEGASVWLTGSTTVKGSLTINLGAGFNTNNYTLTLEGDFSNDVLNGKFDAGSSNIIIAGATPTQSITGFTTSGNVSMTKTTGVASFTGDVEAAGLILNGDGGTLNLGVGRIHKFTSWTRTYGTLEGGSSTFKLLDTVTGSGGTFVPGTGLFWYLGATQNVAALTYNNLKIQNSGTKTTLGNITVNGWLRVDSSANFTVPHGLTVMGNTYIVSTLTSSSSNVKTFNGLVTIYSGGVWNNSGNADVHFRGGLTYNGATFSAGTGTYFFETNNQIISGVSLLTIPNLTVEDGITLTNNNSGGLSVTSALKGSAAPDVNGKTGGTLIQGAGGVLNIGMIDAGFTLATLDASMPGNTVKYNYGGIQEVRDIQYHSLSLGGSGAKTLPIALTHLTGNLSLSETASVTTVADLDIDGNLSVADGALLTVNDHNFIVGGNTNIAGTSTYVNGKLLFNSASGTKSFGGLVTIGKYGIWDNTIGVPVAFEGGLSFSSIKPFVAGNGLYTFQNTASQVIGGTYTLTIPNLAVGNGVELTNTNSSAEGLSVTTSLSGLGTLAQGDNAILNISVPDGGFTLSNLVASAPGNTVNYNGSDQTVKAVAYHNLTLSVSGVKTLTDLTTVNGNLILSGSTHAMTESNLAIGGSLTVGGSADLTVGAYDISVGGNTTVYGTLTHNSAVGVKLYAGLVTITGDWINTGNANITFRGGLNGDISEANAGIGVYTFDTSASQSIASGSSVTVKNLTVASGVTLTNNGSVNIKVAFNVDGAWVQGTSGSLTITGTSNIASLNASAVGNTVKYASALPQTVIGIPYHHLVLSGGSVKTLPAGLTTVNGNMLISTVNTSATLAADLAVSGNITIDAGSTLDVSDNNYAINLAGNWTCSTSNGAFIAHSGTVVLQDSVQQTVEGGDCSFNNLTLNNPVGAVLIDTNATVNGVLTLTNGKIETGTKTLVIGPDGSFMGVDSTKYIVGNLRKSFAASVSPQTFTFPIGDAAAYMPVDLTVDSVSTAGTITVKTTAGEHPSIATVVGLNQYMDVNRYWTLTPALIEFSTYSATFNFIASDLDAGADTANFVVKRYDTTSAVWNSTTVGTRTLTSTQVNNIPFTSSTNVYSFAIGEGDEVSPTITNITSTTADGHYNAGDVISGITVTFSEDVDVTGMPQLTLETGAADTVLNYAGGTGTDTLTFSDYTVQPGDTTGDLDALSLVLNGGSIEDMFNNPAVLTLSGTSLATNKAIVIDTTAPETQIDSGPASLTNSTSAAFTFSADETSTFECQLDGGGFGACASPYAVVDGSHIFDVRATDLAGNTDATSASHTWTVDATGPTVVSSLRVHATPTAQNAVKFTVTFSEPVTGVDTTDFSLTLTKVTGAIVTEVAGSGTTYTVTATTGVGNGTIQLVVLDDDSILDEALNPLNGAFVIGQAYTVNKALTYKSVSTNDGWVLESSASSNIGGTINSTTTTFNLGDDASKKQYRGILHFNTATLPDNAVITSVTLKILKSTGGSGNTATLGLLLADIRKLYFSTTASLQNTDFQATAQRSSIFNAFIIANNWYSATMKVGGYAYVNRTGTTQFRLRFTKGDDGDGTADYLKFFSGNATLASRPQLIIQYYVPMP